MVDEEYMLQYGPLLRWILESDPTLRAKRVHGALRFHRRKPISKVSYIAH